MMFGELLIVLSVVMPLEAGSFRYGGGRLQILLLRHPLRVGLGIDPRRFGVSRHALGLGLRGCTRGLRVSFAVFGSQPFRGQSVIHS